MIIEIGLALLLLVHLDHGHRLGNNSTTCDFTPGHEEPNCNLKSCRDVKFVKREERTRCEQYWKCDGHQRNSHRGVAELHTCPAGLAFIESLGRCDNENHHPCGQICREDGRWKQGKCLCKRFSVPFQRNSSE